jgi:hypothetical protein
VDESGKESVYACCLNTGGRKGSTDITSSPFPLISVQEETRIKEPVGKNEEKNLTFK